MERERERERERQPYQRECRKAIEKMMIDSRNSVIRERGERGERGEWREEIERERERNR